jgi:hypothetical protein
VRIVPDAGGAKLDMSNGDISRYNAEAEMKEGYTTATQQAELQAHLNAVPQDREKHRGEAAGVATEAQGAGMLSARSGIGECSVQYYIDGAPQPPDYGHIDQLVRPQDIAAVEIFRNPAEVPPQYRRRGSDCGVVLIWTRAFVNRG